MTFKGALGAAIGSLFLGSLPAGQAFAADHEITLAATVTTSTAMYRSAEAFKEAVERRSDGRVAVELAFDGVFGGDRDVVELLQLGEVQMMWGTDIAYSIVIESLGFPNLPYLFPTYEAVDEHYFGGFIGDAYKDILLRNGIRHLGWGENDYRHITTSRVAVTEVEDLAGLKLRVPQFPSLLSFFLKLGANPTPMAFTEIYTALQQKTIDGQDNGPILTASSRFYEVQDHFTSTSHVYSGAALTINEEFFEDLPADIQAIIAEEGEKAAAMQLRENRADVSAATERMKQAGIQFHELSPEARGRFLVVAKEVWQEFADQYDPELMARIQSEFGNF